MWSKYNDGWDEGLDVIGHLLDKVLVSHCGSVESRHWELSNELLDINLELVNSRVNFHGGFEILQ